MSSVLVCSFCKFEGDESSIGDCDSVKSCPQCGAVLEEKQIFSHDIATRDCSGSFANSNGTKMYGLGFSNLQRARLPTNETSKGRKNLNEMIDGICAKLQLPSEVVEQTRRFVLEEVNEKSRFKMTNKKIRIVGSCIYIICRANGIPITFKQIAVASGCSHFVIGGYVKIIDREFNLYQTPVSVTSFIPVACSYLSKPKDCEDLALQLYARSRSAMALSHQPVIQAIAHSVIVSLALNKGTKQSLEVTKLCEKMSQECSTHVIWCVNALKRFMITLLEEIPWIQMKYVNMTNVHHYVKDIVKYKQNIGTFTAESSNPLWFDNKKKATVERREKIKNAEERIRLKKVLIEAKSSECLKENDELKKADGINEATNGKIKEACDTAKDEVLDREDKIIENLLMMGCSPEELEDGYYESAKSMLQCESDISDHEIESYMRTPDEVQTFKRITNKQGDCSSPANKRKRL